MGYNPNISHLQVGYNHLLLVSTMDIPVCSKVPSSKITDQGAVTDRDHVTQLHPPPQSEEPGEKPKVRGIGRHPHGFWRRGRHHPRGVERKRRGWT